MNTGGGIIAPPACCVGGTGCFVLTEHTPGLPNCKLALIYPEARLLRKGRVLHLEPRHLYVWETVRKCTCPPQEMSHARPPRPGLTG